MVVKKPFEFRPGGHADAIVIFLHEPELKAGNAHWNATSGPAIVGDGRWLSRGGHHMSDEVVLMSDSDSCTV